MVKGIEVVQLNLAASGIRHYFLKLGIEIFTQPKHRGYQFLFRQLCGIEFERTILPKTTKLNLVPMDMPVFSVLSYLTIPTPHLTYGIWLWCQRLSKCSVVKV